VLLGWDSDSDHLWGVGNSTAPTLKRIYTQQ